MTRSTAREIAIELCYSAYSMRLDPREVLDSFFSPEHYETLAEENALFSEQPGEGEMKYIRRLIELVGEHREEIDSCIEQYAHGWRLERISRTALAVLRCAICEILYLEDVPPAAAINEAVEIDKNYDDPDTVAFVNGVLGGFMRGRFPAQEPSAQE